MSETLGNANPAELESLLEGLKGVEDRNPFIDAMIDKVGGLRKARLEEAGISAGKPPEGLLTSNSSRDALTALAGEKPIDIIEEAAQKGYVNPGMTEERRAEAVKLYERDKGSNPEHIAYTRAWANANRYLQHIEETGYPHFETIGLPDLQERVAGSLERGFNTLLTSTTPRDALIGQWSSMGQRLRRSTFLLGQYFNEDEKDREVLAHLTTLQGSLQGMYAKYGFQPHDLSDIEFPLPTRADRNRTKYQETQGAPVAPSLLSNDQFLNKVGKKINEAGAVYCDIARIGFDIPQDPAKSEPTLLIAREKGSR